MKLVLLVSENTDIQAALKHCIKDEYHFVCCSGSSTGWIFINNISQGLVFIDIDLAGSLKWLQRAKSIKPDLVYIGLAKSNKDLPPYKDLTYDFLLYPFDDWQLGKLMERAWEKVEQTPLAVSFEEKMNRESSIHKDQSETDRHWAKVLSDFSRALSNQFNKEKFLGKFLAAIKELVPIGKMSVLLKEPGNDYYEVIVQNGLDPNLHNQLRFQTDRGLIFWLSENARILDYSEACSIDDTKRSKELIQEMRLLNAEVCLPLSAQGKLCGVLCLGSKVTGVPFYEKELELLYSVCSNVAYALNDLDLHEKLINQNIYIESILQLMTSGVIAINEHDKINAFNRQAGLILGIDADKAQGCDLRILPSPLGDMLYETKLTGNDYHKEDLTLRQLNTPLEVSTYRMINENNTILGSVMIIDDISQRKKEEVVKRKAEQIEVLNRFVSQLTHEIKNPMVAIRTFSELLPDRYEDPEFRDIFAKTVNAEIKRLNELVDQLIAFSSSMHYNYETVFVNELLGDMLEQLKKKHKNGRMKIKAMLCRDNPTVKADKKNLARAFLYLADFFVSSSEKPVITVKTACMENNNTMPRVNILITDTETQYNGLDIDQLFNQLEY